MKRPTPVFCLTVQAIALLAAAPAMAQTDQPVSKENTAKRGATEYWTAERFKAAKPLPMPAAKPGEVKQDVAPPQPTGKPESSDAQPPSVKSKPRELRLYRHEKNSELGSGVEPQANGTYSAPYTSTRVFPIYTGSTAQLLRRPRLSVPHRRQALFLDRRFALRLFRSGDPAACGRNSRALRTQRQLKRLLR